VRVEGNESVGLCDWFVSSPSVRPLSARVPGTAAGALRDAGRWSPDDPRDFDAEEWTFTTQFAAAAPDRDEEIVLRFDGIATVAAVELNGHALFASSSMFEAHEVEVGDLLAADNELVIRCAPLLPLLRETRRPRARWRTRIVAEQGLRFFRTTMLGRAAGFAPRPAPVGPWRPVSLERRRTLAVDALELRAAVAGGDGILTVRTQLRMLGSEKISSVEVEVLRDGSSERAVLPVDAAGVAVGAIRIRGVERWWPHTHGDPALYDVRLRAAGVVVDAGRVGFRTLESRGDAAVEGIDLRINGSPLFARGAVWMPIDIVGLASTREELYGAVSSARDAGMNMLRLPGTACYEAPAFHDACDELGVLVWQDLMFANFDYPFADPGFAALAETEARSVLSRLAQRPSTAVVCGNSEAEQQAAMLGLDPSVARTDFFDETVPALLAEIGMDAPYVPSTPTGGDMPFRPACGVANYYGVGAYLRPFSDARTARVRFAAECLAFANVPDDDALLGRFIPRDVGAEWDFADVRDHYLREVFGVEPADLRRTDLRRYADLSRAVTGEVMAAVIGEWRRAGSTCNGALVLAFRDVLPGEGWGVLDHLGRPKVAWQYLRRACAPIAVWLTDEGLGGIDVHVANDLGCPLEAELRIALYREFEVVVEELTAPISLDAHGNLTRGVEELLGRFVDVSYAYRFGPPGHDLVVASLEASGGALAQSFAFPSGLPIGPEPPESLGLRAVAHRSSADTLDVVVSSRRFAYCVRAHADGYQAVDDAVSVEPGKSCSIRLVSSDGRATWGGGYVTALNLARSVGIRDGDA
jgi:beta-mannosidase